MKARSPLPLLALIGIILGAEAVSAASISRPALRLEVSHEAVRDVLEVDGETWCATSGGVQIYRGERLVRALTPGEGLPPGGVRDLEPFRGDVLAATGTGLFLISRGGGPARRLGPAMEARCSATDSSGTLWAGTAEALVSVSPEGEVTGSSTSPVGPVASLYPYDGELFAAGTRGLARLAAGGWISEPLPSTATEPWMVRLFEHKGDLYAAGIEGLWVREASEWKRADTEPMRVDVRDGASFRGELWLATGEGVWSSVDARRFRRQAGLPPVRTLLASAGGGLMAGTEERGLWVHVGRAWKKLTPAGPPPGEVMACAWEGERLWVAGFRGRLAVRDERGGWRDVASPALPGEGITHLAVVGREVRCRTSDGRLWERRSEKWEARARPLAWCSTLNTADGRLCVGGLGQAWVREGSEWTRLALPNLGKATVTSFLRFRGSWWIGTQHGLYRQLGRVGWKHHTLGTGLRDDWVTGLTAHANRVWVGTFGGGVAAASPEGARWQELPGSTNRISAMASGPGAWFGSPDGLFEALGGNGPLTGAARVADWNVFALAASGSRLAVGTDVGIGISRLDGVARQMRSGE